jgi:hypothetical protein
VRTTTISVSLAMVMLAASCGKDAKKDDKPADAPKVAEAGKPEAKAEAKADGSDAFDDVDDDDYEDALHFDVAVDRSGVLARAASVLETTEAIDADAPIRGHLAELSHHAERGPSNEALCKHIATLKSDLDIEACARDVEHHRVRLGPEVFAEDAACIMKAKTGEDLERCEAAEKEAEKLLHTNKHGEGLDEDTCEKLFVHFEKLAMADAGEHAKLVEEVLEEVRADIIEACLDHGTKAEVECAMKAEDMETLGGCESSLL